MSSNAPQIAAIHVHFHCPLVHALWVALCLGFGRVLALAVHTSIPLRARFRFPRFILASGFLTVGTVFHSPILAHPFGHSLCCRVCFLIWSRLVSTSLA